MGSKLVTSMSTRTSTSDFAKPQAALEGRRGKGGGGGGGRGGGVQTCVQEAPGEKSPVVGRYDQHNYRALTALGLVYGGSPSQLQVIQLRPLVCNLLLCTTTALVNSCGQSYANSTWGVHCTIWLRVDTPECNLRHDILQLKSCHWVWKAAKVHIEFKTAARHCISMAVHCRHKAGACQHHLKSIRMLQVPLSHLPPLVNKMPANITLSCQR